MRALRIAAAAAGRARGGRWLVAGAVAGIVAGLILAGCGYLPASKMAGQVLGEGVYVEVELGAGDLDNSIFLTDTVRELFITRLGRPLVAKKDATTTVRVRMSTLSFAPLAYDGNGFAISYRARLDLDFVVDLRGGAVGQTGRSRFIRTSGFFNFNLSPNSIISDAQRSLAIRAAAGEALDEFVAILGASR